MSDFDPVAIFMFILKAITVVITLVIFVFMFNSFSSQIKTDDLERFSIELSEDIMSSQLTKSKYVFDDEKLEEFNQNEYNSDEEFHNVINRLSLDFLESCEYDHYIEITNLRTGEKWKFGYRPSEKWDNDNGNIIQENKKVFYAGINSGDDKGSIYGTVDVARIMLVTYDTALGRFTCAVRKAYEFREVQKIIIGKCMNGKTESPVAPCMFVRKSENRACLIDRSSSGQEFPMACRSFDKNFDDVRLENPKRLTIYPIKEGTNMNCGLIDENAIAKGNDRVERVIVCEEAIRE